MALRYYVTGYQTFSAPATGLNDQGAVVGAGYLYQDEAYTTLAHPLATTASTVATDVNNNLVVVGQYANNGIDSFLYDGFNFTTIKHPSATYTTNSPTFINGGTYATDLNDGGTVVGYYKTRFAFNAFSYFEGLFTNYGANLVITGINNSGLMVGYSTQDFTTAPRAGYTSQGGASKPGATSTAFTGVNDFGQIVGYSYSNQGVYSIFVYSSGVFADIVVPAEYAGTGNSEILGINNAGQIILNGGLATLTPDNLTFSGAAASQAVNDKQTIRPFATAVVDDSVNPTQIQTVRVTLDDASEGTLSNLAGGSYDAAAGTYTISGTAVAVTSALNGLVFTPTQNQVRPGATTETKFRVEVSDGLSPDILDTVTSVLATSVNDPSVITGTRAGQAIAESGTTRPFAAVRVIDLDSPSQILTATVTLSVAANGILSNLGGGSYNPLTGVYSITGRASSITAALDDLVFTPTARQGVLGTSTATPFSISVSDGSSAAVTNATTSVMVTDSGNAGTGPLVAITGTGGLSTTANFTTTTTIVGTVSDLSGITAVNLFEGGVALGAASLGANGSWSFNASFAAGTHAAITAVATAADGETAVAAAPFTLITGLRGTPYSSQVKLFDEDGHLAGRTYYNPNGTVYLAGTVEHVSPAIVDYVYSTGTSLAGSSYNSYRTSFTGEEDRATYLGATFSYSAGNDSAYDGFATRYSAGNAVIGTELFDDNVPGQIYSEVAYAYDRRGELEHASYSGVSGAGYSSYRYDYNGGVLSGSTFTVTDVAAGAGYSRYELNYDYRNAFTGVTYVFDGGAGQIYDSAELDFDAGNRLTGILYRDVVGQPYSSLEQFYDGGAAVGYKAYYTNIVGQAYTSQEVDVSFGQITRVVKSGLSEQPYSSIEQYYENGSLAQEVYNFTNVANAPYYAYHVTVAAGGIALQQTIDNNDGSHTIVGFGGVLQTFTSVGDDTFTGGAGFETFVFEPAFGQARITDFHQHTDSDRISFDVSQFADFQAVMAAASNVGDDVVISAANGDTLTLSHLNTATLATLGADFLFHI